MSTTDDEVPFPKNTMAARTENEGTPDNLDSREPVVHPSRAEVERQSCLFRDLVELNLANGRQVNVVGFVDQILALAAGSGSIRCSLANENALRIGTQFDVSCEVHLQNAKAKLRALCARLATVCNAEVGHVVSPYGGEAEFDYVSSPGKRTRFKLQFANTPDSQQFSVEAQSR